MTRFLLPVCLAAFAAVVGGASPTHAQFLLSIPGIQGGVELQGFEGWMEVDSVDLSVDRDLTESGEKGGTQDINIGVGELSEFRMTKLTDMASASLFGFAINGNSVGTAEVVALSGADPNNLAPFAIWRFDRVFVKDYQVRSAGSQLRDNFSLYFNKIAYAVADGRGGFHVTGWDNVTHTPWNDHGLPGRYESSSSIAGVSGDFNSDGRVDAADYTVWRDDQASTFEPADYDLWRNHYGAAAAETAAASVPAPAAAKMLALALSGVACRRPKRQQ